MNHVLACLFVLNLNDLYGHQDRRSRQQTNCPLVNRLQISALFPLRQLGKRN
ncbi:hypothetical protein AHF37_09688 [Paragonimus kellicotti]|nr:hypothetical protein AHF37_09688 [Paragonimus kellicotti]